MSRHSPSGPFTIGGETIKSWPSVGSAISAALNRAERAGREIRLGVYHDGRQVYRVERDERGSVTVGRVER